MLSVLERVVRKGLKMAIPGQGRMGGTMGALCLCGASGVVAGAFGAHALRAHLTERLFDTWQTAVFYLFVHVVAGLVFEHRFPKRGIGLLMLLGILLFSGSLFTLVLTGWGALGAITPVGGVVFVVAWLFAGRSVLREQTRDARKNGDPSEEG